jgi:hypothetical protein
MSTRARSSSSSHRVDRGGGTELTITEENLPSNEAATTSEAAWAVALKSLKEQLERARNRA